MILNFCSGENLLHIFECTLKIETRNISWFSYLRHNRRQDYLALSKTKNKNPDKIIFVFNLLISVFSDCAARTNLTYNITTFCFMFHPRICSFTYFIRVLELSSVLSNLFKHTVSYIQRRWQYTPTRSKQILYQVCCANCAPFYLLLVSGPF